MEEERKDHLRRVMFTTIGRREFIKATTGLAAGVALTSLLAACGDDDDDDDALDPGVDPGDDEEEDETAEPDDEETEEPDEDPEEDEEDDEEDEGTGDTPSDQELIVGLTPDPINMSPWLPNSMTGYSMHYHVYEPVIFRDDEMELAPLLAESWEQVEPDILELHLQQGIMFHNGEELTADAVKFSYEKVLDPEHGALWRAMLSSISEVEVVDDYTVRLHTHEPNRALIRNLTLVGIMSESIYDEIGEDWASNAIGTGPYTFVSFAPGERLVLERNDDYWGEPASIQRLDVRIITETSTRISALQTGEIMVGNNVPPDQVDRVDQEDHLDIISTPTARIVYMGFRTDRAPYDDVRVRQAANYAVNKEEIVEGLFLGLTDAADGPLESSVFAANNDLGPWPYDPDRARELLAEAGVENPPIVIGTPDGRYIQDRQVAEAVAGYLEEVGFQVDFRAAEFGDFQAEVLRGPESEFDLHLLAWGVINLEPDYQLRDHFHGEWSGDRTGYSNPEVTELLDEAAATVDDPDEAERILREAQELIWEDCPWIWLYYQPEIHGVNSQLSGYTPRPDEYILFNRARLG